MAGLQVKALQKRYGSAVILKGIDLDVRDGEFVVLVGPSGCGKSTLLRMIAGLDEISDGELWLGSKLANKLSPQQRNTSMVFQSYALFPHMTTRANIGANRAEIDRQLDEDRYTVTVVWTGRAATLTLNAIVLLGVGAAVVPVAIGGAWKFLRSMRRK